MRDLEWEEGKYEKVGEFEYLGTLMTEDIEVSVEIQARIVAENRCFCAYNKLLRSTSLSKSLKLTMYRIIIRPMVLYQV